MSVLFVIEKSQIFKLFKHKPICLSNNVKWKTNHKLYCTRAWNHEVNQKENISIEIKILSLANRCVLYPNQETIANEVVKAFKARNIINTMVLVKTQSGKTGSMCATV